MLQTEGASQRWWELIDPLKGYGRVQKSLRLLARSFLASILHHAIEACFQVEYSLQLLDKLHIKQDLSSKVSYAEFVHEFLPFIFNYLQN